MFKVLPLFIALSVPAHAGPGGIDNVGDRGPRPHFGDGPGQRELPPHVRDQVLANEAEILQGVASNEPDRLEQLKRLRERDFEAYIARLAHIGKRLERARNDPAAAERMREIQAASDQLHQLAVGFGELDGRAQKERRAEMSVLALQIFEMKQAERAARVDDMRAKIEHLQAEVDERAQRQDEIVKEYVERLIDPPVDL